MTIDLLEILDIEKFFAGISWDPYQCMSPYKTVWPDISSDMESSIALKIAEDLRMELARIYGITTDQINPSVNFDLQSWFPDKLGHSVGSRNWFKAKTSLATDKRFAEWRSQILVIMAKWMPNYDGTMLLSCHRIAGVSKYVLTLNDT